MQLILSLLVSLIVKFACSQEIELCDVNGCADVGNLSSLVKSLKSTDAVDVDVLVHSFVALFETVVFQNLSSTLDSIMIRGTSTESGIGCNLSFGSQVNAGLIFEGVNNISIFSLNISRCGVQSEHLGFSMSFPYSSGVYFMYCNGISLHNITVMESCGSGITMLNNSGNIEIINSSFLGNKVPKAFDNQVIGGNGIFMLLGNVYDSVIYIQRCDFISNIASSDYDFSSDVAVQAASSGGGLSINIINSSMGNSFSIIRCNFKGNSAIWGGGMNIRFYGEPQNNTVTVSYCMIEENFSHGGDGGGLEIGIVLHATNGYDISNNLIRLNNCTFSRNCGEFYGGGTSIYSSRIMNSDPEIYFIKFTNCTWQENTALAGSAIDISPSIRQIHINGVFPRPLFVDCSFVSNAIKSREDKLGKDVRVSFGGIGAILSTGFIIQFYGRTEIRNNAGTGLYLSSGIAEFLEGSSTTFYSNKGENGGAIFVSTFSSILLHDGSQLNFDSNRASFKGGAVYVFSSDPHEKYESRTCFIQCANRAFSCSNISFSFNNNTAMVDSSSDVFVQSVKPCSCPMFKGDRMETFRCLGQIHNNFILQLLTSAMFFKLKEESKTDSILSEVVPGNIDYSVPINAYDTYNETRNLVYEVSQSEGNNSLRPRFTHITRNRVEFEGNLNVNSIMKFESEKYVIAFNIASSDSCPPGYVFNVDSEQCVCGAERILGIAFCNAKGAYITHGYWIGKCSNGKLCTSHCPLGFCGYLNSRVSENAHLLPRSNSILEEFICSSGRVGILCGSCRDDHSAFYHSYTYACRMNQHCKFGVLFYVISELFPLTVMFIAIIVFEIKFTAGQINGFILFAQVMDSLSIDANGVIVFPRALQIITDIHRFVYRTLNFDFFSLESLSFCFWRGSTTLDAMAMKYVTVLYALALLVFLIIFMNTWKCKRALSCWKPSTIQGSSVNGVTAFIVICYSQCARVSFQILSPAYPRGINYTPEEPVVFRRGEFAMFRPPHLKYAIPALFVLLIMSLIPLLLILYPLVYRILSLCKLSESKLAKIITKFFPIPLLDLFQSSFKDNCRFFAGFYFLYRLFALAAYAYSSTLVIFYTVVELQLILILALHSTVQPYKKKWHNVIDSLIFANLAIINGFTLFNYFKVINSSRNVGSNDRTVTFVISLQAILVYLPLLVVLICLSILIFKKIKSRLTLDMPSDESLISSIELPPLRIDEDNYRVRKKSVNDPDCKRVSLLSNNTYGI